MDTGGTEEETCGRKSGVVGRPRHNGEREKVEAEAREIIDIGRDGGVIIGTHSLSPEVRIEYFAAYDRICKTYGDFAGAR